MPETIDLPKSVTLASPEPGNTRYLRIEGDTLQSSSTPNFVKPRSVGIMVFLGKGEHPELVQTLKEKQYESGVVRIVEMRDNQPVIISSYKEIQDPDNLYVGLYDKGREEVTRTFPAHIEPHSGDYAIGTTYYEPGATWNMREYRYIVNEVTDISTTRAQIRLAKAFQ